MIIKLRRGTSANRSNIVPAQGELIATTDTSELFLGDGVTPGGIDITSVVRQWIQDNYLTESDADGKYISVDEKGVANGVATLDANGKVVTSQLPALAISSTSVVASEEEMLALDVQEGDVAVRTDTNETWIRNGNNNGDISDWTKLLTPEDNVLSVNGKTGVVVLNTDDIDEGTVNKYFTEQRVFDVLGTATLADIGDVDETVTPQNNNILVRNSTTNKYVPKSIAEVTKLEMGLLDTKDTPESYEGHAGEMLVVKDTEDGMEFTDVIDGGVF